MKKLILFTIITIILVVFTFPENINAKDGTSDIVNLKYSLMKKAKKKEALKSSKGLKRVKSMSSKDKEKILLDMMIEGTDQSVIDKKMEDLGVYRLHTPKVKKNEYSSINIKDVSIEEPSIYYNAREEEWFILMRGNWENDNWWNNRPSGPLFFPRIYWNIYKGFSIDMGGRDGFGVSFTSVSDEYNTRLKRSNAIISDGNGNERRTEHRSDGDSAVGFGFQLQDVIRVNTEPGFYVSLEECGYIGKRFTGMAVYDEEFANYSGIMTAYYMHTYNDAYLYEVDFGVNNNSPGIEGKIENDIYSFSIFSSPIKF